MTQFQILSTYNQSIKHNRGCFFLLSFILVSNCIKWCHWYFHVSLTGIYQHAQKHMFRFMSFMLGLQRQPILAVQCICLASPGFRNQFHHIAEDLRWQSKKVRYLPRNKIVHCALWLNYINEPLLCNAGIMMYIFIIFRVKNSPIQRGTMHRV